MILKWDKKFTELGSFDNLLFQSVAEMIISKINKVWSYFKVKQTVISKWEVNSKWGSYFRVGHYRN